MLLIVTHSRSGRTQRLAEAVHAGAVAAGTPLEIRMLDAFDAGAEDVLASAGVILGTPARFGYMSGATKDFLERVFYPCLDQTKGRPWALFVKGDTDVTGATSSVERIVAGLAWRRVLPVLEVVGDIRPEDLEAATELGGSMAAGLEMGLW
ncbi:MAG TPA: flavodoxin domain-containing protein [Acidimicrobiales bacterium]|nr:flavodoxin domain-containing protein [Acidimicrobiales bacterium]